MAKACDPTVVRVAKEGSQHSSAERASRVSTRSLDLMKSLASMPAPGLSGREQEVLRMMSLAMSAKTIARMLGISLGTVKWHKKNVYEKLGVRTQEAAVLVLHSMEWSGACILCGQAPSRHSRDLKMLVSAAAEQPQRYRQPLTDCV